MRSTLFLALCAAGLGCSSAAGSSRVGSSPDASSTADGKAGRGRLPPAVVQQVVRASFKTFRGCYEQGLGRDPMLMGRIHVRFVIGLDGRVQSASEDTKEMRDRAVADCVVGAFRTLSFPPPQGGLVTVVYPILFAPDDTTEKVSDCLVETKAQGTNMVVEKRTCAGWASMITVINEREPVGEAFADTHRKGFEAGAAGKRATETIAGKTGWSSVVVGAQGQPYRKLFVTQYAEGAALLASCQDEQATDHSERCEKALEKSISQR